jgi:hypothetical protein
MSFQKGNKAGKGGRPGGRKGGLTAQRELFAREYVTDLDAIRAVQVAFDMPNRKNASTKACHLMAMPCVAALIAELKAKQFKRLDIKADDVLQELMRLADVDPALLFDHKGKMLPIPKMPLDIRRCISGVERDQDGRLKIKFWSKTEALGMLARHYSICIPKTQVEITDRAAALAKARARVQAAVAVVAPPADPAVPAP